MINGAKVHCYLRAALRHTQDVCVERFPSNLMARLASIDYAYGLQTTEKHVETLATFGDWLRA